MRSLMSSSGNKYHGKRNEEIYEFIHPESAIATGRAQDDAHQRASRISKTYEDLEPPSKAHFEDGDSTHISDDRASENEHDGIGHHTPDTPVHSRPTSRSPLLEASPSVAPTQFESPSDPFLPKSTSIPQYLLSTGSSPPDLSTAARLLYNSRVFYFLLLLPNIICGVMLTILTLAVGQAATESLESLDANGGVPTHYSKGLVWTAGMLAVGVGAFIWLAYCAVTMWVTREFRR